MIHICLRMLSTLTGVDVNTRLQDSLDSKGKKVLHFFQSQLPRWTNDVRTVLKDINRMGNINHGVASLLVTIAYFKEKEDSLFLLADVSTWDFVNVCATEYLL